MTAPLHIIKLAPGAKHLDTVREWCARQLKIRASRGWPMEVHIPTRTRPKRADEIAGKGSLFWVAGGQICGRQRILGFDEDADAKGTFCVFRLDPEIVEVRLTPRRAFQGWRYLTDEDAPADLDLGEGGPDDAAKMPDEMRAHLQAMGVL